MIRDLVVCPWRGGVMICSVFFLKSLVLCSSLCGHFTLFPVLQQARRREAGRKCRERESVTPIGLLATLMERSRGGASGFASQRDCKNVRSAFMLSVDGFVRPKAGLPQDIDSSDAVLAGGFPGGFGGASLDWRAV